VAALGGAPNRICPPDTLTDGGHGVRFTVRHQGAVLPAFAIRYQGRVHAYLNRCAHKLTELDWEPGQFFDAERRYLVCATHGALYEPDSGLCVAGPCRGAALVRLPVGETTAGIYLEGPDEIHFSADRKE
jgi:nitrite reductase/ring-hydroxylating ferredoxin subunit